MNNTITKLINEYAQFAGLSREIKPFTPYDNLKEALKNGRYLMAPMAGVSDSAYRIMARLGGASLAYTEMVSVAGVHFKSDKTWDLIIPEEQEIDIAVQLFGSKPEQFAEATNLIQKRLGQRLAIIDINMACPVPKVVKKGEGSALLDEPDLAAQIVDASKSNCKVPVTVKIRKGRRAQDIVAPEFALKMQEAGASAVAVHGRTASQMYSGLSDRLIIAEVKKAVSIPVISSGDVLSAENAVSIIDETDADASFIARGTYGNPWIFNDAKKLISGEPMLQHSVEEHMNAFMLHVKLLEATGANLARARSLAGWFFKGIPGAAAIRGRAVRLKTADDFCTLARDVLAEYCEN